MDAANAFLKRWGLSVPLVQAPTGSIAGPELCAAVCRAGAMGSLGLTWTAPEVAAAQVRQVRQETSGAFLVNFALHFTPHALDAALDAGAQAVLFSWGDPARYLGQVRRAGAAWGAQVTSADGARHAGNLGADFLIVQGSEAGGHVQAAGSLWDTLPRVLEAAPQMPTLAAGGIADGASWARAIGMGAAGAVMGTRFVASRESRAHETYKKLLCDASGDDTTHTVCFDGGWPYAAHRVLRNTTFRAWEACGSPPPGQRPGEKETVAHAPSGAEILRYEDTAPRQGMRGDIEAMCLYAGMGCGAIDDVPAAGDLVARLWAECQVCLACLAARPA